jgi:hypothetical protein
MCCSMVSIWARSAARSALTSGAVLPAAVLELACSAAGSAAKRDGGGGSSGGHSGPHPVRACCQWYAVRARDRARRRKFTRRPVEVADGGEKKRIALASINTTTSSRPAAAAGAVFQNGIGGHAAQLERMIQRPR